MFLLQRLSENLKGGHLNKSESNGSLDTEGMRCIFFHLIHEIQFSMPRALSGMELITKL